MKKICLELDDNIYKLLEEITNHFNNEDGLNINIDGMLRDLIILIYHEIKNHKDGNKTSIRIQFLST